MKLILAIATLALLCVTDADAARLIVRQRGGAAFTAAPVGFAGGTNVNVRAGLFGRRSVNVNVGGQPFVAGGGAAFLGPPVYNNGAAFRFRRAAFAAPQAFNYGYNQQNFVAPFRYRQNFVAPLNYGYQQQNLVAPQQAFSYQQALTTGGCQQQNFVAPQQAYSYQQQAVVAPQPCQQSFQYQQEVVPQPCQQNLVSPQVGGTCGSGAALTAGYGYGGAALTGGNVIHHHNHYSLFGGRRSFR